MRKDDLAYFTDREQETMLREFNALDARMIHEEFGKVVAAAGGGTSDWPKG